jgi:hypothetical protein
MAMAYFKAPYRYSAEEIEKLREASQRIAGNVSKIWTGYLRGQM